MATHNLKAVTSMYAAIVKGRRVDLRALGERDIRPGDKLVYHEVDEKTRKETGKIFNQICVKTSPHFPLSHNSVKDLNKMSVLGFVAKQVLHPIENAAVVLEVDDGLFRAIWSGNWNVDIRPARDEIRSLAAGDIVGFRHVTPYDMDTHMVGRVVNHNDTYDMGALFGTKLPEVLAKGLLVVGLEKLERLK